MSAGLFRLFRAAIAVLALGLPPALASDVVDLDPQAPLYRDIIEAAQTALASELRQPTRLSVTMLRSDGAYAGLAAELQSPDNGPLDWSVTPYAEDVENGFFDGPYLWALLHLEDGQWTLIEYDIGPTDAWFISWPSNYGADCSLMGAGITAC